MAMFEVGEEYEFRMIEDGGECTFGGEVVEIDGPLIKLGSSGGLIPERIINTASASFVSGTLRPHRTDAEKAASLASFKKLVEIR